MKKIVLIGGGTGLSTFARVLKRFPVDLTLIVAVTDDGGSSGLLRESMKIPPPGDLRNNLIALADDEETLTQIFSYRFASAAMDNHSLGNIIIAGLTEMYNSFPEAIVAASKLLKIKGRVLPVADELVDLVAMLEDETRIEGETKIATAGSKIAKLSLNKKVRALNETVEAIEAADTILVGPGSVYTSLVPNFLVEGISEAFRVCRGEKVYVCNIMTQPGESEGFGLKRHVQIIQSYVGSKFDKIFWTEVDGVHARVVERYKRMGAVPVNNDLPDDSRVIHIGGATTELITDGKKKLVLRHSKEGIISILRELKITGETDR